MVPEQAEALAPSFPNLFFFFFLNQGILEECGHVPAKYK